MDCTQCGAALLEGRNECPACGAPVSGEEAREAEAIERWLAEANLLRIRKRHDEAISLCTRILRLDPSNATAHSLMGDIYRDEGNPREALGWYKLAVQLNPRNLADRKKLDEMIDRVFHGAGHGDPQDTPSAGAGTPFTTVPAARLNWRALLDRITPTHVIVAFSVLALLAFIVLLFRPGRPTGPAAPAGTGQPLPTAAASGTTANGSGTPAAQAVPQVTPPPTDIVEAPDGSTKLPNLPIIVTPGNAGTSAAPPAAKPPVATPPAAGTTPAAEVNKVPPMPIQVQQLTAEELQKETLRIRASLETALKKSELQSALTEVELDPRTKVLSVAYTIPHMYGPQETKQGLIYSGFILVWAADRTNAMVRSYNLKGYAFREKEKDPSLALLTDVTPQQADAAREAGDYKTAAKYMMNAWWRDDLSGAPL